MSWPNAVRPRLVAVATTACLATMALSACGEEESPATAPSKGAAATGAAKEKAPAVSYHQGASGKGKTYAVTAAKITAPANASAPYGDFDMPGQHDVAVDLVLTQTDSKVPGGAVNSACFTGTDSDGKPAKLLAGMVTPGAAKLEGVMKPTTPLKGQLVWRVADGKGLKSITAKCDVDSSDAVQVTLS